MTAPKTPEVPVMVTPKIPDVPVEVKPEAAEKIVKPTQPQGSEPINRNAIPEYLAPATFHPVGMTSPKSAPIVVNLSEMVEKLADQLMVSQDITPGLGEIRMSLKDKLLPDTEIRIIRSRDQLEIRLVTGSESSRALLVEHRANLQTHLSERLDESVKVNLQFRGSDREENQGRSRQRYIYEEEDNA